MRCGLLGEKLGHSYSPQIHAYFGEYTYELFERSPEQLSAFLQAADFNGINVTIPYKKSVIPYCDHLSAEAEKLGSVNTVIRNSDGTLAGYNTDYFGFHYMLQKSKLDVRGKKVLVLGSGGAAVTVCAVMRELGALPVIISRSGKNNYQNIHIHQDASVIVNATPVGMYPNTGISPVDIDPFSSLEGVLDIVYNPARTQLLLDAERKGLTALNGLWMLVAQAKQAAELFTNKQLSDTLIDSVYHKMSRKMQNTILIGMPGSGKTTIGKILATISGKDFIDADNAIATLAGKSIPDIFSDDGETAFRAFETQVLSELGKRSGLVIATGGGCVTQNRNYPHLHQNGRIIWIKRDLELLATDGRPLSQSNSLQNMYQQRQPLYAAFADTVIHNDTTPEAAAALIAKLEENHEDISDKRT